uniref:Uncharacterized protein n=1 Tax=Cyanothece sp. (strain PCC 7425 / ATCC 29141) TaxID=395961 RepID=B8HJL5_CYAP4
MKDTLKALIEQIETDFNGFQEEAIVFLEALEDPKTVLTQDSLGELLKPLVEILDDIQKTNTSLKKMGGLVKIPNRRKYMGSP